MGCEKAKGGFASTMRASIERRRVSNAKVTSLSLERKFPQESTVIMQKEQEKLERAKEILERRKSQRDRLNACMLSLGTNPNAKRPDHLGGMRRPGNTDGMFGRPQWTASLQSDYESLIKLREKEIAVATLRIENHKQLPVPCTSMQSEEDTNPKSVNGNDEPYLLNEEFEFHQDAALEQESQGDIDHFDSSIYHNVSNDSYCKMRNDMEDLDKLEHELFAYANETEKLYHTDSTGTDLLLIEPAVFREHIINYNSFNRQSRTARSLPPRPPPSTSKVVGLTPGPPLKSCLKSIKDNQKSITCPSLNSEKFPNSFPNAEASSERIMSNSEAAATSNMEIIPHEPAVIDRLLPMSNDPQTVTNRFFHPWDDHQDQEYANDSFEVPLDLEYPDPRPADDLGKPGNLPTFSMSTESLEKQVSNAEPEILRPKLSRHESEAVLSRSGIDTVQTFQESERGHDLNYASDPESWQEGLKAFKESSSAPSDDSCHRLTVPPRLQDKKWGAEEESFITSLDSEAATTRLLAEVVAIQARLEDCKLKPIDFDDIFDDEPVYYRHRIEQQPDCNMEIMTPAEETHPLDDESGHDEVVNTHNEQGVNFDMNIRNYSPVDTDDHVRKSILETIADARASVDDHGVLTQDSSDQVDNFTEMPTVEGLENLHGAAWGISWTREGQQTRQESEPSEPDQVKNHEQVPANSTVESASSPFSVTRSKPAGSTTPVESHLEKSNQPRVKSLLLNNQQQRANHVSVQTDCINYGLEKSQGETPRVHQLRSPGISTQAENCVSATLSDQRSLLSTDRASRYLNIGYRDLSEAPQVKHPKRSFYSSQGLLQVGYSQPRQSPNCLKQAQASGFHDSLRDKENWCMSDDQELSILASLEKLDWKLAAISARAKNRTTSVPTSLVTSQDQISIQSAPAATGAQGLFPDRRKFHVNQMRPGSSVSTQEPPTRNFRQRRIHGVSNKSHQNIYN